jgi:hypothetical protein
MDGVVEDLRTLGIQRWRMGARDRELLEEISMGSRGSKWAVELLIIIIITSKFTQNHIISIVLMLRCYAM